MYREREREEEGDRDRRIDRMGRIGITTDSLGQARQCSTDMDVHAVSPHRTILLKIYERKMKCFER